MRIHIPILASFLIAFATGCADSDSPEARVRATIAAIEEAAEARDVGGVLEHVSVQFRDGYGQGPDELSRYLRGYFIANPSIHLLSRIEAIEFPTSDEARAKVTVGMVGREAAASGAWDLAAEIHDFDVTFMREDGEWKVTHAKWGSSNDRLR